MARPRSNRPVPVHRADTDVVIGPPLGPAFTDLEKFAEDILQYSERIFRDLRALESRYWRDQLHRVEDLTHLVETVKADIADMRESKFNGLRRVFTDTHPECTSPLSP
jgi:hypothetical protein